MPTPALDPDVEAASGLIPNLALTRDELPTLREQEKTMFAQLAPPLSDAVERTDHLVSGDPHVVVRVHRPKDAPKGTPLACLYSIHGGGYVIGSYGMDDAKFDRLCADFQCVGVSVEYRLSPETTYPGPLDDCYAGLLWTYEHADELGIDRARIGLTGVSAGGGLAAGLALLARDHGEVPLAYQLLECPMLDDRQVTASSRLDGLIIWSREANTFGWQCYLGDLYGRDDIPPYAAAARATDEQIAGLPPTFVITGGADGFRDENITYAMRLGQAGVFTDLEVVAGAPHGVQMFIGTAPAKRWTTSVMKWLAPKLSTTG